MKRLLPLVLLLIGCEVPFEAETTTPAAGAAATAGSSSHAGAAGSSAAGKGGSAGAGAAGSAGSPMGGTSSSGGAGASGAPTGAGASGEAGAAGGTPSGDCTAPYAPELGAATAEALPKTAALLTDFSYCEHQTDTRCTERPYLDFDPSCALTWGAPVPSSDGSRVSISLSVSCLAEMIDTTNGSTKSECAVGIKASGEVTLEVSAPVVSSGFVTWGKPTIDTSSVTWKFDSGCRTFGGNVDAASEAAKSAATIDLTKSLESLSLAETCE